MRSLACSCMSRVIGLHNPVLSSSNSEAQVSSNTAFSKATYMLWSETTSKSWALRWHSGPSSVSSFQDALVVKPLFAVGEKAIQQMSQGSELFIRGL